MSYPDRVIAKTADIAWKIFQSVNTRIPEGQPFQPASKRSETPLSKASVTSGNSSKAIPERSRRICWRKPGRSAMRKTCPEHGPYEDVLSIDPESSRIIENLHLTATTSEWFKTTGRHAIYAGNRDMALAGCATYPQGA